ncbi:MAG: WecB/TagA/CpsF family glycosyltransferase [Candidatus Dormibacteria bacterium]
MQVLLSRDGPSAVRVLGVRIDDIDLPGAADRVLELALGPGPSHVVTVNPEFVMLARRDPGFRGVLEDAALSVADGRGCVWAARRRGARLRDRVTGVDLVSEVARRASETQAGIFLLGAAPGVAAEASATLEARFPGLIVSGTHSGSPAPQDEEEILARVRASGARILLVAFGTPAQEFWLNRCLARSGARVGIGVGGAFDYISGRKRRAPAFMQRSGLEWLHRLLSEPRRARRMSVLPGFAWLCLREPV